MGAGVPRQIGEYQILRPLGSGAMANVLLGERSGPRGFSRAVAIKRLHTELARDEDTVSMFIDEARISSRMSHENIAQVVDFGEADDSYFIAMEYVEGSSLHDLLGRCPGRKLDPPVAAHVVAKICAALDHAHRLAGDDGSPLEVVHRDVKPSNVLISNEGRIKLIDFGVAKAAQRLHQTVGMVLKGSYAYMSPEQASNDPIDHRSDIFAAGTVLYELLVGENPFVGVSPVDTLERVRHVRMSTLADLALGIPDELVRTCGRAMAAEPDDRYATAGEMQAELELYGRHHPDGGSTLQRLLGAAKASRPPSKPSKAPPRRGAADQPGAPAEATEILDEGRRSGADDLAGDPELVEEPELTDGGFGEDLDTEPITDVSEGVTGGLDGGTDVETGKYDHYEPHGSAPGSGQRGAQGDSPRPAALQSVPTTLPTDSFPELAPLIGTTPPVAHHPVSAQGGPISRRPVAGPEVAPMPETAMGTSEVMPGAPVPYNSLKVVLLTLLGTLLVVGVGLLIWFW